jgi:hypothetical protein
VHPENDTRRGKVDQPRMECPGNRSGFDQIDLGLRATPPDRRLVDREVDCTCPSRAPPRHHMVTTERASA